jgi:hypothetical protein
LQVAWDALLPAVEKFAEVYVVSYNLACYACQMGRLPEARHWLKRALEIAEKDGKQHLVWLRALDDPDLSFRMFRHRCSPSPCSSQRDCLKKAIRFPTTQ